MKGRRGPLSRREIFTTATRAKNRTAAKKRSKDKFSCWYIKVSLGAAPAGEREGEKNNWVVDRSRTNVIKEVFIIGPKFRCWLGERAAK